MFAPDINDASDDLAQAYNSILSLDGFATTSSNLRIVKLPKDPDWLPPVRGELNSLNQAADSWLLARPNLWSQILLGFSGYIPTFTAFVEAAQSRNLTSKAQWITLLETVLLPGLSKALTSSRAVHEQLEDHRSQFSAVLPEIDKSIQAGWNALGSEEQAMLTLATEIGGLNERIQNLSAKFTSDTLSGGKSYVSSAVSMLYAAGSAGAAASIPILGVVTTVFAIGKTFYDLIEDDDKLIETMQQVNALQAQLSDDAQGLALTKATLQILYNLEATYLASRDAIPAIIDLWSEEESKVQDAINALNAGAAPDQYLDLLTLPTADANWQAINEFVRNLMASDIQIGQPVTLDIATATIKPTLSNI